MDIVDGVSSGVALLDQRLTLSIEKKLDLMLQQIKEVKEKQAGLENELRQLQRPRNEVPPLTPPPGPSATATQEEKSKQPTLQVATLPLGPPKPNTRWFNSSFTEEPDMDNKENENTGTLIDDAEIVRISRTSTSRQNFSAI